MKMIILAIHETLALLAHAKKSPINAHADLSSGARGLKFGLNLQLFFHNLCIRAAKTLVSMCRFS